MSKDQTMSEPRQVGHGLEIRGLSKSFVINGRAHPVLN